jgi:hypothetical protein
LIRRRLVARDVVGVPHIHQSRLVLAVPLAIIEPFNLIAVIVAGDGHFFAGVLVMICAYACSLFVTERLFTIVKPKLLILPWFATIWNWFVTIRAKVLRLLRHKWIIRRKALFEQGR